MTPHGLHHRYYARDLGTYGAILGASSQFPRGHLAGLGQGEYCLGPAGNVIPCDSSGVMATLPALPGGGWIPSGQNIQTSPPTATTPALPAVGSSATSTLLEMWPLIAGGVLVSIAIGMMPGPGKKEGRRRK